MHMRIRIEKGPNKGDAFEIILESKPVIVGRGEEADFMIPNPLISKKHCKVFVDPKNRIIWIKDLNSTNGTFINGEKIDEVGVHAGDKIQMGEVLLSVEDASRVQYTSDLSGKILAGYRLDKKIGRGSMGTVYRAIQISLGREVALKVLDYNLSKDIKFVRSFLNEARAAGQLNHPNVVQVHDVTEAEGYYLLSMEYIAGGSLKEMLVEKTRIDIKDGIAIILCISRALEFAEKKKVIHCDIKPDNIMLNNPEEAKLADLGIAKKTRGKKVTQDGKVFGSPNYIAPEQAKGESIDNRVDIYSLGITAYEMFSGKVPFTGTSSNEIIKKHIYEKPKPLPELVSKMPEELWNIIAKMIAKSPDERYTSAIEITEILENFTVKEESGKAPRKSRASGKVRMARRRRRRLR
jgi:serine/threonine protein kinase